MITLFRWQSRITIYLLALIGAIHVDYASAEKSLLPEIYKQIIDRAVIHNTVDRPTLIATISWVTRLAERTQDPEIIGELARLECANAEAETEKNIRIARYKHCVETANKALAIHSNEVSALYWKAVALGNISEESSILDAVETLSSMRAMEWLFLQVIILDETYDFAGAHNALGRMYHKLPGFPISFGNKEKALFHIKRAYTLFPDDIITRAFYAELLFDMGKKQEAHNHARFILSTPIEVENRLRFQRFIDIAHNIFIRTSYRK